MLDRDTAEFNPWLVASGEIQMCERPFWVQSMFLTFWQSKGQER